MKALRNTNIFLLIVAIICTIVFTVIQSNEEKYSVYDKKITFTETDMYSETYYGRIDLDFEIKNKGKETVKKVVVEIEIKNIFNYTDTVVINGEFFFTYGLDSNSAKTYQLRCPLEKNDTWILNRDIDSLLFNYKIKQIVFLNGKQYKYE